MATLLQPGPLSQRRQGGVLQVASRPWPAQHMARPHQGAERRRTSHCSQLDRAPDGWSAGSRSRVDLVDLSNRLVPYQEAWALQKELVEAICQTAADSRGHGGAVVLLQHHPVYTLGAGSTERNLRFDPDASPLPLYRTERGGEVTYHGPGQLVMYPILNLRLFRQDLHWYLRRLEEVIIRALAEVSGLEGKRIEGLTGVWVDGAKVAAIGVRASRWVTYHGLALNVAMDLRPFEQIVPCGISDRGVTSVQRLLGGGDGGGGAGLAALGSSGASSMSEQQLLEEYKHGLLQAFECVFGVELRDLNQVVPGSL